MNKTAAQRRQCMPSHESLRLTKDRYKMPARYSAEFGLSRDLATKAGSGELNASEELECDRQIEASMTELREIYIREQSSSRPHVMGETHIRVVHVPRSSSIYSSCGSDSNYHGGNYSG